MGELKNRGHFSTTIPLRTLDIIREMSNITKVPISRLTEEAFDDFFIKNKKLVKQIEKNLPK